MKILVAYSSGYGTTREVAEEIKSVLSEDKSFVVDLQSIDDVEAIDAFDGVVLGSSVRAEHTMANMVDFLTRHRHELRDKPFALFLVCLSANCETGREAVKNQYIPQLLQKYPVLKPIALEAFGGKIDFDRLNPVMKNLMRRVLEKSGLPTSGSVDTRDWDYIRQWAAALRQTLLNVPVEQAPSAD